MGKLVNAKLAKIPKDIKNAALSTLVNRVIAYGVSIIDSAFVL